LVGALSKNVVVVLVVCNITGFNRLGLFVVLMLDFDTTLQLVRSFLILIYQQKKNAKQTKTETKTKTKTKTLFSGNGTSRINLGGFFFQKCDNF
jgi:ABC-type nickel/cobalt efflux system permease component RcnA